MLAMWMLSGSTSESGSHDMMAAILLRGFGLGFLFLSITLIAFSNLNDRNRASGIGLFNAGRQVGGLIGVGLLQRMIDHNVAGNIAVLGASVTAGVPAVSERMTAMTAMLAAKGMDAVAASRAATSLLGRAVTGQSTVIAFDTAFNAVALLFVFAAPGRTPSRSDCTGTRKSALCSYPKSGSPAGHWHRDLCRAAGPHGGLTPISHCLQNGEIP